MRDGVRRIKAILPDHKMRVKFAKIPEVPQDLSKISFHCRIDKTADLNSLRLPRHPGRDIEPRGTP
jgi:hypothetical protein